jgi:Glycosyl hydrolase family 65 central catalytic domain
MNIEHPYFPLCLGNGLDSVMVDYSGSMHCDSGHLHLEQQEGAICCWEKLSHRTFERKMVPIAQFPYRITAADGELFEVGTFKQQFNPKTAILTTDIEACIIKIRIKTFLTDDGLYVENYKILWIKPGSAPALTFFGRIPRIWHLNLEHPAIDKIAMSYCYDNENIAIGKYSFETIEGDICMAVDCAKNSKTDKTSPAMAAITVSNLSKGEVISRYISMQDNSHNENPEFTAKELVASAMQRGFSVIAKEHSKTWDKYYSGSKVKLPDAAMQKVYDTSLWLMKASQNRQTGFVTEGLYDAFKGGGYSCFWDTTFMARAWATSNQRESLKKLLDFYQSGLEIAQEYASQLHRPGAYYPWMCNHEGRSIYFDNAQERPAIQKWNNCCMLVQLFDSYRFLGDKSDLTTRLPLIKEIIDFLIAEIVAQKGKLYYIKAINGADENIPRLNDTAHLIPLIEGLRGYIKGCSVLAQPVDAHYADILAGLEQALQGNIRNDLIYPWQDAERIGSALFTYDLFLKPAGIGKKNIMTAYKASQGEWGLTNPGTFRNLIWPWTEAKAAIALATLEPKLTYQRLQHVVKFTSTHGIFPEKIRPDGFWILMGYLSAHAGYVYALNSMLAADDGKTLFVIAGIPESWQNISFSNIYTASGLGVRLKMVNGKIEKLVIENSGEQSKTFMLKLHSKKSVKINLKPGNNRIK